MSQPIGRVLACLVVRIFAFLALLSCAVAFADYSQHPKAIPVIDRLVAEHGFSHDEVIAVLTQAKTESRILDSMKNAAEKTKTWTAYKKSFLVDRRIDAGISFYKEHQNQLRAAQERFGVEPSVIVAILGVETNYGGYTGKANVLNALATLAFDHPSRGKFFTEELIEYIRLTREKGWNAAEVNGSYAGAMGMSQFMPSNYRRLAVDGNNDGEIDLMQVDDAIFSVANYLKHHGWKRGEDTTFPIEVSSSFDASLIGKYLKPNATLNELQEAGYVIDKNLFQQLGGETEARVVRFNDSDGDEFWLGLNNFYVISRYNPRAKYAMAVHLLSESIRHQI